MQQEEESDEVAADEGTDEDGATAEASNESNEDLDSDELLENSGFVENVEPTEGDDGLDEATQTEEEVGDSSADNIPGDSEADELAGDSEADTETED